MKNKLRLSMQLSIVAMILYAILRPLIDSSYTPDFEAYCPLGGIASLMSRLNLGSSSCQMGEVQMMLGISLIVGAIFFGKLFCSFLCPVGTFMEWLGRIGDKFNLRFNIPEYLDRPLRLLKYALLFYTIYETMNASELFCKEYDPYLASVTFFQNGDVVWYFALITIGIVILGSIFTKMFWCKYLCPLGAIGNIFSNVGVVVIALVLFFGANLLGAELGLVWLLGGVIGLAALSEILFKKSFLFPLFKITRNDATCPTCVKCDDDCPQGIDVSTYDAVNHADCTMCGDCVYSCPVKQTISVNKMPTKYGKYAAPVGTIILIAAGIIASNFYEFKTLTERWGEFEKLENVEVYHQEGLTSMKCWGSASSFKNQIARINGIVGVDAYPVSHTADIYYNPNVIDELGIKKAIFQPVKQKVISTSNSGLDSLAVVLIGIDNFFDKTDFTNLTYSFRASDGIFGFETIFGEPVETKIYYDEAKLTPEKIVELILTEEIEVKMLDGSTDKREIEYEVEEPGKPLGKVSVLDYQKGMFKAYDKKFNNYSSQNIDSLSVLVYPMEEAGSRVLYSKLSYLTSHLSSWKGIVRLTTKYDDAPMAYVYFQDDVTPLNTLIAVLSMEKMRVHFRGGEIKLVDNPFKSKPEGIVKKAIEIEK
ncbi:MAG: 4Fe-4S binding protein [Melioribacteraceae bacterium]|jgi:ferredoxin|nr:4Fe-4S binding protein [Melioribacteraceae bacterium]